MKYCRYCGSEVRNEAAICPKCGCSTGVQEDRANGVLIFLSIWFPLLGIILAAVNWSKTPRAAKTYLITSLITIGVYVFLCALMAALVLVASVSVSAAL